MRIALPLDEDGFLYHLNPLGATTFALIDILTHHTDVTYHTTHTLPNPWLTYHLVCEQAYQECTCTQRDDPQHKALHYLLLEALQGIEYLIADRYCLTTLYALRHAQIKIHKIPPFIKTTQEAIHHFIIAQRITPYIDAIYPA